MARSAENPSLIGKSVAFVQKENIQSRSKIGALQICLFVNCRNEQLGCDGAIYINSFGLQGFATRSSPIRMNETATAESFRYFLTFYQSG